MWRSGATTVVGGGSAASARRSTSRGWTPPSGPRWPGAGPSSRTTASPRRASGRGSPDGQRIVAGLGRVEGEVRSLQHRLLDQEDWVAVARRIAAAKTVLEGIRARVLVEHMRHRLREGAGARGGRGCFAGGGPGGSPERTELVRHREGGD